jgi:hypothetical protein
MLSIRALRAPEIAARASPSADLAGFRLKKMPSNLGDRHHIATSLARATPVAPPRVAIAKKS